MALSNWDTLALDSDGKPCSGRMKFPSGLTVEIYKNWVYLYDPRFWNKESGWAKPCIGQIEHGRLTLGRVSITCARHRDQSSVFVYAVEGATTKVGDEYKTDYTYFSGIGCYGFMSSIDFAKLEHPRFYKNLSKRLPKSDDIWEFSSGETWGVCFRRNNRLNEIAFPFPQPTLEELWTGVKPSTEKAFLRWIKRVADKEYYKKVAASERLRFNQGDAYFASHLGTDVPATKAGESTDPIIASLLPKGDQNEAETDSD